MTMTIRSFSALSTTPGLPPSAPIVAALKRPTLAHDHNHCIASAMATAVQLCERRGARLTPMRRRVLELIWASHKALGAYELLDQLALEGHKPAPPTIYRALDFLLEQHLIHRLSSLNAYLGCSLPGHAHTGYFLICSVCSTTEEVTDSPALQQAIEHVTQASGFAMAQGTLELSGTCVACANKSSELNSNHE